MYTVMVTGGIGSGKSLLCDLLCEHGAVSLNLDEINRSLLESNASLLADLAQHFGEDIIDEDGVLDKALLAQRAFADKQSVKDINAISFPYITEVAADYILNVHCAPRTDAKALVVEVPLLTEVPEFAKLADEVIAISAPSELRLQRAVQRGMGSADVLRRMALQPTDAERAEIADTICDNSGTQAELEAWAEAWWNAHKEQFDA